MSCGCRNRIAERVMAEILGAVTLEVMCADKLTDAIRFPRAVDFHSHG